jgi:sugar phosphate isomerase/epimerase
MSKISRRSFVKKSSKAAMALPLIGTVGNSLYTPYFIDRLPVHIFSKHLQFLDFKEVGQKATELGFAGVDLTIRPNGHVKPEEVKEVLPAALSAIRDGGSKCRIITTAVESAANEIDRNLLKIASENGIDYYRCNWFHYPKNGDMATALDGFADQVAGLSRSNKELGLIGCYQNHAGTLAGASPWEVKRLLSDAEKPAFGVQFDIRHAKAEAGLSWENSLRLLKNDIKTIVLKDFIWKKKEDKWMIENVPIGEGMVDFKKYFGLLKKYKINAPAILHLEYGLGGAEHGKTTLEVPSETVYNAMRKDLKRIQELWAES